MRPSAEQIARVAETLARRLVEADVVQLDVPEDRVRQRFAALLTKNFDDEESIENEAVAEAEKIVRRGAPGVRREDLDLRRVEQLVKQRIAKARGFVLLPCPRDGSRTCRTPSCAASWRRSWDGSGTTGCS